MSQFALPHDGLMIAGYGSLFNQQDLAGDVVAKGAFSACLANFEPGMIAMLAAHDPSARVGRWLSLREDETGLWVEGVIDPALSAGKVALAAVQSGRLSGLSIGFRTLSSTPLGQAGRTLTDISLMEVSLVGFPMLPTASIRLVTPVSAMVQKPKAQFGFA